MANYCLFRGNFNMLMNFYSHNSNFVNLSHHASKNLGKSVLCEPSFTLRRVIHPIHPSIHPSRRVNDSLER
jgi:hypothetical protein